MTQCEKRVMAILMLKYQSQHDLQMTHLDRTKMLEIAAKILENELQETMDKMVSSYNKKPPF